MLLSHTTEVGTWYINLNNQFLRVWGVIYNQGIAEKVVLHYLNGNKKIITMEAWQNMELIRYPEQRSQQSQG